MKFQRSYSLKFQPLPPTYLSSDLLSMVTFKVIQYVVLRHVVDAFGEATRVSPIPPHPLAKGDIILVVSHRSTKQDSAPPRVGQETFQALSLFTST